MTKKLYFLVILWYNSIVGFEKIKYPNRRIKKMFNEEIFKFNIDNIKNDLAIEGMDITENDVNMYRMLAENEVAMPELINMIKEQI